MFFRFFNRKPQREYTIVARYGAGNWMRQFVIEAASPYEACRKFDTDPQYQRFTRVSGATTTA